MFLQQASALRLHGLCAIFLHCFSPAVNIGQYFVVLESRQFAQHPLNIQFLASPAAHLPDIDQNPALKDDLLQIGPTAACVPVKSRVHSVV